MAKMKTLRIGKPSYLAVSNKWTTKKVVIFRGRIDPNILVSMHGVEIKLLNINHHPRTIMFFKKIKYVYARLPINIGKHLEWVDTYNKISSCNCTGFI